MLNRKILKEAQCWECFEELNQSEPRSDWSKEKQFSSFLLKK